LKWTEVAWHSTKFHDDRFRHLNNITVIKATILGDVCWYYWSKGFKYAAEMASCGMIYIPSFMNIGTGIQAILRSDLRNLRGCNFSIIGGFYYLHLWDELRCHDIHTKFHNDWFRHSKINKGGYTQRARWYHKPTFIFQIRKVGYK
jgi:hypothetical protein